MRIFVKDWRSFQHFKDRNPIWIKLYRKLLDDIHWHELPDSSAKLLISLWLLASEDKNNNGELPPLNEISFRLRIDIRSIKSRMSHLNHWLRQDDINTISDITTISTRYQDDALERERETERETETDDDDFSLFWNAYPRKKNKGQAEKAWRAIKSKPLTAIMAGLESAKETKDWTSQDGKFIPYPATWLSAKGWEDESSQPSQISVDA